MFTFIIPLAVCAVCIASMIARRIISRRQAAAAQAAAEQAAAEKKRQAEQARREKQAQAEREQAARRAAATLKKQEQEQKRQEQEQRRAAAHAVKAARAAELAELAERRLQAEKELAQLRQQPAARPAIIPQDEAPALTLDQFAASVTPQPFPVECMLAKKYADNAAALDGKSFTITEKLDGVRCLARVDRADVRLYTRSGKRIEGLTEIEKALAALDVSAVLDGELLINGRGVLPSKEEYKQTCSIVRSNGPKTGIVYHVFDMIPLEEYAARRASAPYAARRAALERLKTISPVEIVPVLYAGTDAAQIEKHLQAQREAHHEGIMINLNDAPYSYARSAALLKYKVMNDCDLQIVALNAGTGKYKNALGSLTVEYKGSSVRVGAGIPDALRRTMWENPDAYIGRVVTVQYFEETQDKTGKKSLRFPAFKELREIGKTVSYA